jgi:acetyltransferase EpsM
MESARDLIVIGGGGHARVVIEAARTRPDEWNVIGFTDPQPCNETVERLGVEHLGDDDGYAPSRFYSWYVLGFGGVGVSAVRRNVVKRYADAGSRWATVIHSSAFVSTSARIGLGTVVFSGAVVNSGAVIGEHCVVNTGAIVEHDVQVGAFTQIGPGAAIGGGTVVGAGSYLGLGCRIRDHICIGHRVLVGMGAVVVSPVEDELAVAGVPARPIRTEKTDV